LPANAGVGVPSGLRNSKSASSDDGSDELGVNDGAEVEEREGELQHFGQICAQKGVRDALGAGCGAKLVDSHGWCGACA